MLDLFAIARGNAAVVEERFQTLLADMTSEEAAVVREFASWVGAKALISINMDLLVVGDLLGGRSYQNTYEMADELARLSGRPAEEILRERLGPHYERRVAFDRAFEDGENFLYGALNAGGAGPTKIYDPYCVVLKRTYRDSLSEIAYLPGDSTIVCFGAGARLDEDAVRRLPAPHTHRHLLAAIERATEVPALDQQEWPRLVASESRYFEVIFLGDVTLEAVECVRALKVEIDGMRKLALANFGRKLERAERALANDFVVLGRGVLEGKLRLEEV
jgi:hypothetical protein